MNRIAPALSDDSTGPGLCVLMVEDSDADAYLIERALFDNPRVAKIVRARDGEEALDLVQRAEVVPDVALIDLHMPRMNGFNLLVALAGHADADFPAIVLTSSSMPQDAARCRLRRAVRVVIKPDTVVEFHAALATAIDAVCPWTPVVEPKPRPRRTRTLTFRPDGLADC
ncbi:MAG TPA: response regulator [Caulobacteraceae bacterium]|jgi:CheY-like chemotaxis protein|nr:response regulator [Caulobacteraceae bacterium]